MELGRGLLPSAPPLKGQKALKSSVAGSVGRSGGFVQKTRLSFSLESKKLGSRNFWVYSI